ncbi:hypothetical protein [Aquabacterium parvum]|uniref:hypothetical protein n=1 Tax=Aquabacterium parvum TaxID=70584 RepID=UPI001366247B|nr:hypothetical protein [Aquabacterium parvum]
MSLKAKSSAVSFRAQIDGVARFVACLRHPSARAQWCNVWACPEPVVESVQLVVATARAMVAATHHGKKKAA